MFSYRKLYNKYCIRRQHQVIIHYIKGQTSALLRNQRRGGGSDRKGYLPPCMSKVQAATGSPIWRSLGSFWIGKVSTIFLSCLKRGTLLGGSRTVSSTAPKVSIALISVSVGIQNWPVSNRTHFLRYDFKQDLVFVAWMSEYINRRTCGVNIWSIKPSLEHCKPKEAYEHCLLKMSKEVFLQINKLQSLKAKCLHDRSGYGKLKVLWMANLSAVQWWIGFT